LNPPHTAPGVNLSWLESAYDRWMPVTISSLRQKFFLTRQDYTRFPTANISSSKTASPVASIGTFPRRLGIWHIDENVGGNTRKVFQDSRLAANANTTSRPFASRWKLRPRRTFHSRPMAEEMAATCTAREVWIIGLTTTPNTDSYQNGVVFPTSISFRKSLRRVYLWVSTTLAAVCHKFTQARLQMEVGPPFRRITDAYNSAEKRRHHCHSGYRYFEAPLITWPSRLKWTACLERPQSGDSSHTQLLPANNLSRHANLLKNENKIYSLCIFGC